MTSYRWNQISAPKADVSGILKAGELFNKATSGIGSLLKEQGEREKASLKKQEDKEKLTASNAFNDALLQANTVEEVEALKGSYGELPNAHLLNRESVASGIQNKFSNLRNEEIYKEQIRVKTQTAKDQKDVDFLTDTLASKPTSLKNEFGGLSDEKLDKLVLDNKISRTAANQFRQGQVVRDAFTETQKAKTFLAREKDAIDKSTITDEKGKRTLDEAMLSRLHPGGSVGAGKYIQTKSATQRAPRILSEAKFQDDLKDEFANIGLISDSQERSEAMIDMREIQSAWTDPSKSELKKELEKKGGLNWIKAAFRDAVDPEATFENEYSKWGEIGEVRKLLKNYREKFN